MKHLKLTSIFLALAMGGAAAWGGGAPMPGPATTPAATMPQDPFTKDLLARLNSSNAAQRDAAQKQLAAIAEFWQQAELLQKMQDATPDPELKAVIQERLNDLKVKQMALDIMHLPPISLRVSGVSVNELATALNDALHGPVGFMTVNARGGAMMNGGAYTLDVKDKPFWDVYVALSQQQPLSISSSVTGMRLMNGGTAIRRYALDGPAIAYVTDINYQRTTSLQTPNGDSQVATSMSAQITFGIDPRIRVARLNSPRLTSAVDNAGNSLANRGSGGSFSSMSGNMLNFAVQLQPTPTMGKSVTLTLEGSVTAVASDTTGTLKDLEANNGQTLTVAGRSFVLTRFTVTGNIIGISLSSTGAQPGGMNAARPTATVYDGAGKQIWSYSLMGGVGSSIQVGNSVGPYRLEIRVPDKTVDIPVKLVLKDVPLP